MQRRDVAEASKLESKLRKLESERWAISHLNEMSLQITQARGGIPADEPNQDDDLLPAWEADLLRINVPPEQMQPVRDALVRTYTEKIDQIRARLHEIGVDPGADT